jgi:hypothetical protein
LFWGWRFTTTTCTSTRDIDLESKDLICWFLHVASWWWKIQTYVFLTYPYLTYILVLVMKREGHIACKTWMDVLLTPWKLGNWPQSRLEMNPPMHEKAHQEDIPQHCRSEPLKDHLQSTHLNAVRNWQTRMLSQSDLNYQPQLAPTTMQYTLQQGIINKMPNTFGWMTNGRYHVWNEILWRQIMPSRHASNLH